MKISTYLLLITIMLFSCHNSNDKYDNNIENKDSVVRQTQPSIEAKSPAKNDHYVLLSNIKTHCFSDSSKKDTFKLFLTGDSLMTARAIFSIISYEGKRIYADTFSGCDLTKNVDGDDTISDTEKLNNIKESVKTFFNNSAFSSPPIFHEDGNETKYWDDIKHNKTAIGFEVIMNHKDFRIAYSKNQNKVLVYWNDEEAGD